MRLASTRLPNKPLADINGKPMVVCVIERTHQPSAACAVATTGAALVADTCIQYHVEVVLTRISHASGTDHLVEVATVLGLPNDVVVVNVQGDEPLIVSTLIDNVIAYLHDHPGCAIAIVAHPIHDPADVFNPNVIRVVLDAVDRALLFPYASLSWARDTWTPAVMAQPIAEHLLSAMSVLRRIDIYMCRTGLLRRFPQSTAAPIEQAEQLEQLRVMWHDECIAILTTDNAPAAEADTPEDLARVRAAWTELLAQDSP